MKNIILNTFGKEYEKLTWYIYESYYKKHKNAYTFIFPMPFIDFAKIREINSIVNERNHKNAQYKVICFENFTEYIRKYLIEEVEINIKYEGYIKLEESQVEKFKKLENKKLNENIDYEKIKGLRLEARQKLNKIKPLSVGQASRISGVSPADISVLLIYLETLKKDND